MQHISSHIEKYNDICEDAISIIDTGNQVLLGLADGAGGISGGNIAAQLIVSSIADINELKAPDDFEAILRKLDQRIFLDESAGESTAIILSITGNTVVGASAGDSECWIFFDDHEYPLTHLQNRKPLIGSQSAIPIGFGPVDLDDTGMLIIGSDGLFNYTSLDDIKKTLAMSPITHACDIVRLAMQRTGYFQDDVAVIVCQGNNQ